MDDWDNFLTLSLYFSIMFLSLQWRHNEHDGISKHQPHDCLLNRLFRHRPKKTSKLRVTGLCEGNLRVTSEIPAQRASDSANVSIWWRHHVYSSTNCADNIPGLFAMTTSYVCTFNTNNTNIQLHSCEKKKKTTLVWSFDIERSQTISSHGHDVVMEEYSVFSTERLAYWSLNKMAAIVQMTYVLHLYEKWWFNQFAILHMLL